MDDDDFREIAPVRTRQQVLDEFNVTGPLVDPQIRSFVAGYVSEVGGISSIDGRYELGDGAHYNLRNIQKFISLHDKKEVAFDVARVLAEQKFVQNDILEIFALWPTDGTADAVMAETFLVALQILVYLTWPVEVEPDMMTYHHHRHMPYLQLAQVDYKRAILQHASSRILNVAVRAALPSMAEPRRERSFRDETIIKIVVILMRNVAQLAKPSQLPCEIDEAEISRSATIDAFHQQDVFQLLLTMAANMGDDFISQDVYVLETLFHLLKGVDVEKLFMEEKKLASENTKEFKTLLSKEKAMLAGYARHAPSRHNRFGTMLWVKQGDEAIATVTGQDVLGSAERAIQKMDQTKKWNKPRKGGRKPEESDRRQTEFDRSVPLDSTARKDLKNFVEEFLDSAFNPFFMHLRKTMEREEERVESRHFPQYFYVMSWFLRAECVRRRKAKEYREAKNSKSTANVEDENFGLIAGVMTQETFVLLNRYMQRSFDEKSWLELKAGMRALTQILLTVQEMSESPLEDDQDIAENIQNRIFYEETTHDRIVAILRGYKDQDLGYLDAVTELSHVFLRMLERYSKQNVDLQIRSKRRARKKQKEAANANGVEDSGINDRAEEAEDVVDAQRTVTERKFDFNKFASRFVNQNSVNTFVAFLRFYNDLSAEQLKRIHRFMYRLAFKMELGLLLYRVDIIALLNKMVNGPEGLDREQPYCKEWEELVRQVFRRAVKKLQERPELIVEMLFSKINSTMYYLEHGHELEKITRAPRAPAELEVKPGMEKAEQIGVSVAVLIDKSKSDALQWVKDVLTSAIDERKSWEDAESARKALALSPDLLDESEAPGAPPIIVKPDNEERRMALFKDNKLRLLLNLVGFQRIGETEDPEATWTIPSALTAAALTEALETIRKFERDPPAFEDGKSAESFLRSKAAAARARKADFDDDTSGDDGEAEFEFPAGGPTARRADALEELKKKRKSRRKAPETTEDIDLEELERKKEARRLADYEKRKKIKSTLFVTASDDESDAEADEAFFAKEGQLRIDTEMRAKRARDDPEAAKMESGETNGKAKKRKAKAAEPQSRNKRRKSSSPVALDSDAEESAKTTDDEASASDTGSGSASDTGKRPARRRRMKARNRVPSDVEESEKEDVHTDTPMSSLPQPDDDLEDLFNESKSAQGNTTTVRPADKPDTRMPDAITVDDEDEDEDDDDMPVRQAPRRATRAGFVIDSDDEE